MKKKWHEADVELVTKLRIEGKTWVEISAQFPGSTPNMIRKLFYRETRDNKSSKPLKVLILDIETSPILVYVWDLWNQNIPLEMIVEDWSVLSWSAKWLGSKEVIYRDVSKQKNIKDDKKILEEIWQLLNEADVVIHQNGRRFDVPKLFARFVLNGLNPPSSFRQIDTLEIAKKHFKFTSNKLQYMTEQLCTKYVKSGHKKFPGNKLWIECLKGNPEAWAEMSQYNPMDILSLEELYLNHLRKWDRSINFNVYTNDDYDICSCGSTNFKKHGFVYSNLGQYQRWICKDCGRESVERENLLTKEKRKSLRK
jgi:hypothetical protein